MRDEIRDAIEAACEPIEDNSVANLGRVRRRQSFGGVHYTLLRVLRELPDDLTLAELRDELEIANNRTRRSQDAHIRKMLTQSYGEIRDDP